jgi:DNA-binding PadR family transcriptional regulator
MSAEPLPPLSLTEWVVLCLIAEEPRHGFAVWSLLRPTGEVGAVWTVRRPLVYRALDRLGALHFVETIGAETSPLGPPRVKLRATPQAALDARRWLSEPVDHVRDVRASLLVKVVLLRRAGQDATPLLQAQRERLRPIVESLAARSERSSEETAALVAAWRYRVAEAVDRLLQDLIEQGSLGRRGGAGDSPRAGPDHRWKDLADPTP